MGRISRVTADRLCPAHVGHHITVTTAESTFSGLLLDVQPETEEVYNTFGIQSVLLTDVFVELPRGEIMVSSCSIVDIYDGSDER